MMDPKIDPPPNENVTTESDKNVSSDPEHIQGEETEEKIASSGIKSRKTLFAAGIFILLVILVSILFLTLVRYDKTSSDLASQPTETVVRVKVMRVGRHPITQEFATVATITAGKEASVAASISAQIVKMPLLKNIPVRQGEILATLASSDLRAQRDEAQAALEEARLNLQMLEKVTFPQARAQMEKDLTETKAAMDTARATYQRQTELFAKGGLALKDLEATRLALINAENAYLLAKRTFELSETTGNRNALEIARKKVKQAEERMKAIEAQTKFAEVRAPISGIVTEQFQYEGEYASAGSRLLTISDVSTVIVKANFPENIAGNLRKGDAVTIYRSESMDTPAKGKVYLVSRAADPSNRSVEVWAIFANKDNLFRVGDAVRFVVATKTINDAIVIPRGAITLSAANSDTGTVMVIGTADVVQSRSVRIGIVQGNYAQVIEGLNENEIIVVEGNYALPNGTRVVYSIEPKTVSP